MTIFRRSEDYQRFLHLVSRVIESCSLTVHAYALMTTHFHLVVTPDDTSSIPRAMQQIGVRYVRYYNRTYGRIGTLWNGRYCAKILDDEQYCLTCLRYVDCNPVRARLTATPDLYEWSSYRAHAYGESPDWLTAHPLYFALGETAADRRAAYRTLCASPMDDCQLTALRSNLPLPVP